MFKRLHIFLLIVCVTMSIDSSSGQGFSQSSVLLLKNQSELIPIRELRKQRFACISFGSNFSSAFYDMVSNYTSIDNFNSSSEAPMFKLSEKLSYHNFLLVLFDGDQPLSDQHKSFLTYELQSKQLVACVMGGKKPLAELEKLNIPVVWTDESSAEAAGKMAQVIFGGMEAEGIKTNKIRLGYGKPENVGINGARLQQAIDKIAAEAIEQRATPGAVVLVAKNGQVIFEKAYGYQTYQKEVPVSKDALYDLASVTKISATTLAVMKLEEQGLIDLNKTMGHYLLQARSTNKKNTVLRDVMLHQAGFVPFIPFYQNLAPDDLSRDSSAAYADKVADGCFIRTNYYHNVMWPAMLDSKLNAPGKYVYSDLSMYVMKEVVEQQSNRKIEELVEEEFYLPLGMYHTGFLPRKRFAKERIIPTENDETFRKTLLQGYVHDQGAAMAAGIAGHAGNFSTANDLAIYGQLLLNEGSYGGTQFFQAATVRKYTSKQSDVSRRGLGFDRWDPDRSKAYPSKLASPATYGHTGYTGTCIWIDPEQQLTYVFLSNRVHPKVSNKLGDLNIRSRIQDAIYEAIARGL